MVHIDQDDGFLDPVVYGEAIADEYDGWFSGPDRQAAAFDAAEFLHAKAGAGPALELGIGTGRVALPLAALGTKVVGIDASPRMLGRLRDKPGGSDIELRLADFADLAGFDVPGEQFALVYVVFSTFCGLADQNAQVGCFVKVAAALRPGGWFVLETFVPDPTRWERGQRLDVDRFTGESTHLNAAVHDPVTQRIRNRRIVLGPGGVRTYPVDLRDVWPSELDLMGRIAGLELAERWAGWAGEPFTATSGYHVSVWRRPLA